MKKRTLLVLILVGTLHLLHAQRPSAATPDYNALIREAYEMFKNNTEGANADYIPYLAKVDPKMFGIAIATNDGKVYEIGETKYEFGIESIEKVFALCLAIQNQGGQVILDKVGVNQTGQPFNSILAIEMAGGRPANPLVNAGAMTTVSLITKGLSENERWPAFDRWFDKIAGRDLQVIDELYQSEAATNLRNQAIAMLLKSSGYMYDDPLMVCDLYTKLCSYGVNARDLAIMAGCLANRGVNPVTRERLINEEYVAQVLAVMGTTGLYETTGEWMYKVGLPSKSGVGGGIIAVVPGKLAIAVFAPPLDKAGNSIKAQKAIQYIAEKLHANVYLGNN